MYACASLWSVYRLGNSKNYLYVKNYLYRKRIRSYGRITFFVYMMFSIIIQAVVSV